MIGVVNDDPLADDDPLMSIGTLSRASLVSIKTLRTYHEQGLLVPASVDPATGYRSYRVSQLADAQIIKRLRDLDVPLRQVAEVVRARDPDITREVLAAHAAVMQDRLDEMTRVVAELQRSIDLPSSHTPVHVRHEPDTTALAVVGTVAAPEEYSGFLGDAYRRLYAALQYVDASMVGASAALYPPTFDGDPEQVTAYLPISAPCPVPQPVLDTGVHLTLVPGTTCAVLTHSGSYATIADTYRQLGAWVARHATSLDGPVREHYVVSVDTSTGELVPDDERRTEIVWPIAPLHHLHPASPDNRK